ncbi:hypothetical protein Tco_0151594 [Tanacetum coccineum]
MDTEDISDGYVEPCFVNGLEAYDGEINLGTEENMISNEFALKLCLDHERRTISNQGSRKEYVHCSNQGIIDFGKRIITIYHELDPFLDSSGETEKTDDD